MPGPSPETPAVVRVGGIDYLNALPLTDALREVHETLPHLPPLSLSCHPPSSLATGLRDGSLDVALVPVVEYAVQPRYRVIPDVCIASHGPVESIRLYHRRPLADVRSVALDTSSRSSVALTRLLFRLRWRGDPEFKPAPPAEIAGLLSDSAGGCGSQSTAPAAGFSDDFSDVDAALLIGDHALVLEQRADWEALDLGAVWTAWTGLPFVYAFWVWKGGPAPAGIARLFQEGKALGLRRVESIARRWADGRPVTVERCLRYLRRVIRYDLGPAEVAGLTTFFRYLQEAGLLSASRPDVEATSSGELALRYLEVHTEA